MSDHPLPSAFKKLLDLYSVIYNLHKFLTRNKVQLTLAKLLAFAPGHDFIEISKIKAIQMICPDFIEIRELSLTSVPTSDNVEIAIPPVSSRKKRYRTLPSRLAQIRRLMEQYCEKEKQRMMSVDTRAGIEVDMESIPLPVSTHRSCSLSAQHILPPATSSSDPHTTGACDVVKNIGSVEEKDRWAGTELLTSAGDVYRGQIVHVEHIPARCRRNYTLASMSDIMAPAVYKALSSRGVDQLYSHQGLAVRCLTSVDEKECRHVCVATSTCSGKSLIYNIPVLHAMATTNDAPTALYIFPTKALAQDQLQNLLSLSDLVSSKLQEDNLYPPPSRNGWFSVQAVDGDTDFADRCMAMKSCNIMLTNPDMLHCSLLPDHSHWGRFFSQLAFVVIDECHMYRGVFGSHVASVLRRLVRVCRVYGTNMPRFICLSATIANPLDFAYNLLPIRRQQSDTVVVEEIERGVLDDGQVLCIDDRADGSPAGERIFVLWNPPQTGQQGDVDLSPPHETVGKEGSLRVSLDVTSPSSSSSRESEAPQGCVLCRPSVLESTYRGSLSPIARRLQEDSAPNSPMTSFVEKCGDIDAKASLSQRNPSRRRRGKGRSKGEVGGGGEDRISSRPTHVSIDPSGPINIAPSSSIPHRESSLMQIAHLLVTLVRASKRVLAFCKTRKLVELVLRYSQQILKTTDTPELVDRIASYRGGYTKQDRHSIEKGLFQGRLLGIVTTCALELGIDVGDLDATLHLGVPDTHSSMWQQAGRAGRGGGSSPALSVIVCFDGPVDQYYARRPEELFLRNREKVILDPHNKYILQSHLLCASNEVDFQLVASAKESTTSKPSLVLCEEERSLWGGDVDDTLQRMVLERQLLHRGDQLRCHPSIRKPTKDTNLRMIDRASFQVIDNSGFDAVVLGKVEYSRAFYELFEGAIYLHQGKQYLVTVLNIVGLFAYCRPVNVGYYTAASDHMNVEITKQLQGNPFVGFGAVNVRLSVSGFSKVWLKSGEREWGGSCSLPTTEYDTCGVWINIPVTMQRHLREALHDLSGSVHAVNHAMVAAASLFVQCDGNDMDTEHFGAGKEGGSFATATRILLYDCKPGGTGVSEALYERMVTPQGLIGGANREESLLEKALYVLSSCPCPQGCPSCIFNHRCSEYNSSFDKRGGEILLREIMRSLSCTCGLVGLAEGEREAVSEEQGVEDNASGVWRRSSVSDAVEGDGGFLQPVDDVTSQVVDREDQRSITEPSPAKRLRRSSRRVTDSAMSTARKRGVWIDSEDSWGSHQSKFRPSQPSPQKKKK